MTEAEARAAARTRERGGLFRLDHAGLVSVAGEDRTTWLNGMVSNDVAALAAGRERSGCPALLLTNRGAIIADLHAIELGGRFWLLLERSAAVATMAALGRFIVADDVTLNDESDAHVQWAVEGPDAPRLFAALGADPELAPGSATWIEIADQRVLCVARGVSGEWARQLIAPLAGAGPVEAALASAGDAVGLAFEDPGALEVLRVESGTPRQGFELGEDVLPAEARLEAAIATSKGCYVGQEIVARLRSRGQVNHLLVGMCFAGRLPERGTGLSVNGKRSGEVTSVAWSSRAGPIGLGFVRREHSEPGTEVDAEGLSATVTALPFVGPGA